MALWWCRAGHTETAPKDAVEVWCGRGGHRGTNQMKRRDLFPNWGPEVPAPNDGRRCCSTYQDAPHEDRCRYAREVVSA